MKACVLDTHVLVWYLARPAKLGRRARAILREVESGKRRAWIPAICSIELAMLRERDRCEIGLAELEATLSRNPHIQLLPLNLDQAHEFAALLSIRDPFDRLVAAAALSCQCPLLSADEMLRATDAVEVLWD